MRHHVFTCVLYLFFAGNAFAQDIQPSNSTELNPTSYPYFNVNSTAGSLAFTGFQIAPLAQFRRISRQTFLDTYLNGLLVKITPANANTIKSRDIALLSCDPEDYMTTNFDAADTFSSLAESNVRNAVILFSRTSTHCDLSGVLANRSARFSFVFTTVDADQASSIADVDLEQSPGAIAGIRPDIHSYTDSSAKYYSEPTPGTAVTMIVLYSITGIITAIFVTIIVTGAIRAHRHPERYGPRIAANGRSRQSRAKGIARAMLETLPIVKFGDQQKTVDQKGITPPVGDVEMTGSITAKDTAAATVKEQSISLSGASNAESPVIPTKNETDISDNSLGCSICTEDFQKGEEVRVLPCDHKFHPDCVDPWLLNVSGTCPLCRIDLHTQSNAERTTDTRAAPPLSSTANTGTAQSLRAAFAQPRDERIAALRRFRHDRRNRSDDPEHATMQNEEEQRGLTQRLRDRFRIRTSRHPGVESQEEAARRLTRAQSRLWMG